jgi:hypothetical protein
LFVGSVGVDRQVDMAEFVAVERERIAVVEAGCPT